MSDTPIFDEVAAELGEPDRPTPCVCEQAPDDCVLHPAVRFAPAAEWPGEMADSGGGPRGISSEEEAAEAMATALGGIEPEPYSNAEYRDGRYW